MWEHLLKESVCWLSLLWIWSSHKHTHKDQLFQEQGLWGFMRRCLNMEYSAYLFCHGFVWLTCSRNRVYYEECKAVWRWNSLLILLAWLCMKTRYACKSERATMYNRGEIMPMIYAVMGKIRSCELSKKKLKNSQQRRYWTRRRRRGRRHRRMLWTYFPADDRAWLIRRAMPLAMFSRNRSSIITANKKRKKSEREGREAYLAQTIDHAWRSDRRSFCKSFDADLAEKKYTESCCRCSCRRAVVEDGFPLLKENLQTHSLIRVLSWIQTLAPARREESSFLDVVELVDVAAAAELLNRSSKQIFFDYWLILHV